MFDCFDLYDDGALDNEIDSIDARDGDVLVADRDRHLSLECEACSGKLEAQTAFVRRLQETGAKVAVYFDAGADDLGREIDVLHFVRGIDWVHPASSAGTPSVLRAEVWVGVVI